MLSKLLKQTFNINDRNAERFHAHLSFITADTPSAMKRKAFHALLLIPAEVHQ
jgi:hypothetical protein